MQHYADYPAPPPPDMGAPPGDMGGAPPGDMGPPPPPDAGPPMAGPEAMMGSETPSAPPAIQFWVPAEMCQGGANVTDNDCAEIGGVAVSGPDGSACFVSAPGESAPLPPGYDIASDAGAPPAPKAKAKSKKK